MEIYNYETENEVLMSCPFCGNTPQWYLKGRDEAGKRREVIVRCSSCGTKQETGGVWFSTEKLCELAISKWNRRAEKED